MKGKIMKQQTITQGPEKYYVFVLIKSPWGKLELWFCWVRLGHKSTREKKAGKWKGVLMKILLCLVRYSVPVILWWVTR